jgi:hypothetical protein
MRFESDVLKSYGTAPHAVKVFRLQASESKADARLPGIQ